MGYYNGGVDNYYFKKIPVIIIIINYTQLTSIHGGITSNNGRIYMYIYKYYMYIYIIFHPKIEHINSPRYYVGAKFMTMKRTDTSPGFCVGRI